MLEHVKIHIVAQSILGWVFLSIFILFLMVNNADGPFFSIGPNNHLHIFNIPINNYGRYMLVVFYTILSTFIRTIQQEVLMPWIIQNVQNNKEKDEYTKTHSYEIVLIDVVYRWFDWFMYMNILLSQVDMMLIETIGNLGTSYYTTHYYLHHTGIEQEPSSISV